jgi:hypothetical protein
MAARKRVGTGPRGPTGRPEKGPSDARRIDAMIREWPDWRGRTMAQFRAWIHEAVPDVVEEVKWRKPSNPDGVPVWSHDGILCLGNVFRDHVRVTFGNGALLPDPKHLFNAALNGNYMRGVDLREGQAVDGKAFRALVRAAVAFNARKAADRKGAAKR